MALSLAALIDAARRSSGEVWLTIVTIDEPSLSAPIRLAMNDQDVVSRSNTYLAMPGMDVTLPSQSEGSDGSARIVLPVIDQVVLNALENFTNQATVDMEMVMLSDPDTVLIEALGLRIVQHVTNLLSIQLILAGPQFLSDVVPSDHMSRGRVPGIFL